MSVDVQRVNKTLPMSPDIEASCDQWGLRPYVAVMLGIVDSSFPTAHALSLEKEWDPETGEEWLILKVTVSETVDDFLTQYHAYTSRIVTSVPWPQIEKLRLSWHFAS